MRVSCLVVAVLLIGCHGGVVTGGVQNVWPAFDTDSSFDEVAGVVGGGVALRSDSDAAGKDSHPTYLEGWVSHISEIEDTGIDATTAGLGLRYPLDYGGYGKQTRYTDFYVRFGVLYQHIEGGNDGWGGYLGLGRDIYINKARTLSVAPEVLVGGLNLDDSQQNVYASVGVNLTWHLGRQGSKSSK